MDQRQSQFVVKFVKETNVDEELAVDILAGTEWNYEEAMRMFNVMLKTKDRRLSFKSPHRSAPPSSASNQRVYNNSPPKSEKPVVLQPPVSPKEKSLHRGISYAHLKARKGGKVLTLPASVTEAEEETKVDSHDYYFMLPDLFVLAPDLRLIIKKDLLDLEMMKHLHKYGHLNWWSETERCAPLYAMNTSGDGNCLLHAASLSIWGMHDRELTLRSALNQVLTDEKFTVKMKKIQRRWKRQQLQVNRELGLEYTAAEWEEEWESVLKLSSVKPRYRTSPDQMTRRQSQGTSSMEDITYESLEEIHVFVLAHILLRPIIVISDRLLRDVNGEPLAPNTFGGIYLPLESLPAKCSRSPIVLAYDASHFCPLLPMSSKKSVPNIIPVTDSGRNILRVQFSVDPGLAWKFDEPKNITAELTPEEKFKVLSEYLDLVKIPVSPSGRSHGSGKVTSKDLLSTDFIVGVPLSNKRHPEYNTLIKDYIDSAHKKRERISPPSTSVLDATDSHQVPSNRQPVQLPSVMPPRADSSRMLPYSGSSGSSSSYTRQELNSATTETRNRGASPKTNHHTSSAPVYNSMTIGHSYSRNPNDHRPGRDEQTPADYNTLGSQGTRGNPQRPNARSPTNRTASAPQSLSSVGNISKPCKNSSCQFYGTEKTRFYCTKCYQDFWCT